MKSKLILLGIISAKAIQLRDPEMLDLSQENPVDDLSKKEIQKDHESEMMQMWSNTVEGSQGAKSAAEIAKENKLVQKKNAETKLSGAGSDVTDWA